MNLEQGERTMRVNELIKSASAANARVFAKTDEKTASAIGTALMRELGAQIDAMNEGRLAVAGFGNFVIRQVAGKDGKGKQKRVLLRRPLERKK
jgi:hypothetical protein